MIDSITAGNPTIIKIDRPLDQDTGGKRGPEHRGNFQFIRSFAGIAMRVNRPAPVRPSRDDREQQNGIGFCKPRFNPEQCRRRQHHRRQQGAAPADEGKCAPVGRYHRADCTDQRRNSVQPDRRLCVRIAKRLAPFSRQRPATNRCQPAFDSARHPDSGCRHNRRSRSSAWSLARNRPRRDPPAEFGRTRQKQHQHRS